MKPMKRLLLLLCSIIFLFSNRSVTVFAEHKVQAKMDKDTNASDTVNWPKGPKGSSLSANSAILIEASSGLVLYSKNADKVHYPASITKIMTTLIALEHSSLDEVVTFSHDAVYGLEYGSSNIGIEEGEKLTMEQCLYAIMLESANEACLGVAEHIAGSIPAFADLMNEKAAALGCKNTHFSNPNGLHSDDHYTSARDMALIAQAAMKNETFRKITSTKRTTIPKTNKKELRYILNHHQMVYGNKYPQYEDDSCIGGKTGYTSKAQNTLVTMAKKGDLELICVIMKAKSHGNNSTFNQYTDTKQILDFGFENFTSYKVNDVQHSDNVTSPFFTKYNTLFDINNSPLHLENNVKVILPNGVNVSKAVQSVTYDTNLTLEDGENNIGTVTYTYGGKTVGSSNIYFTKETNSFLEEGKPIEQKKSKKIVGESEQKQTTIIYVIAGSIGSTVLMIGIVFLVIRIRRRSLTKKYGSGFSTRNKDFDKL